MKIHPTAIISTEAQIADDAEIGPYVVIEGGVVIGAGCVIQAHAILTGTVRLGKNNCVGYGSVIGGAPQALAFRHDVNSEVWIGDNNVIREHSTIHRGLTEGSATRLGNDNFLMAGSHLGHDCVVGNNVIIANNALLGGHVEVQDRVFIGGSSVFHQFVRVGTLAMIQGNSGFSKDVPPFTIGAEKNCVVGLNVVGLRRSGFNKEQRQEIKDAFKLLYKSGFNVSQALEHTKQHHWNAEGLRFFEFVAASKKRGVCDLLETVRVARDAGDDE